MTRPLEGGLGENLVDSFKKPGVTAEGFVLGLAGYPVAAGESGILERGTG